MLKGAVHHWPNRKITEKLSTKKLESLRPLPLSTAHTRARKHFSGRYEKSTGYSYYGYLGKREKWNRKKKENISLAKIENFKSPCCQSKNHFFNSRRRKICLCVSYKMLQRESNHLTSAPIPFCQSAVTHLIQGGYLLKNHF